MRVLYQDLLKFLDDKPSINALSEKLFQLGHEHEIIDQVFDIDITPNRGDCLSLLGIARDLSVFFGIRTPYELYNGNVENLDLNFKNLCINACPKISFLEIEIHNKTSRYKPYMEGYFSKLDNKKVNFFTDISNYLSYELGQPTHCFDKNKLTNKIIFNDTNCNQKFKTLTGSDVQLHGKNSIFLMNNEVISLAGVMGGLSTACSENTYKVLVECAYFEPESIIGKSLKYNLNSEAAYKFERGVDYSSQEDALRRFIKIVEDHAEVKNVKIKSFGETPHKKPYIKKDHDKINHILGINLAENEHERILHMLGFKFNEDNTIEPPSYRGDIETHNDLAEEIARVIGFNNIESSSLDLNLSDKNEDNKEMIIQQYLIENGFTQTINFSFSHNITKNSISIDNPLDSKKKYLRDTIKESLIENLLYNERRQKESIKLFEISDIYTIDNFNIISEKKLGIIASGRLGYNYDEFSKNIDINYLNNIFHKDFGFCIEEVSRKDLNTKKSNPIYYIEIPLDMIDAKFFINKYIKQESVNFVKYSPISELPSSNRDLSFLVSDLSKFNILIEQIENLSDEILKEKFIFDIYKNEKMSSIKIGYRFIFQSTEKTLSDHEINQKIDEFISPIIQIDGVSIPGM